jgi:hypothetical protein
MYTKHPSINTPHLDSPIWRYMDLWKFLDIVYSQKLYCSRADLFEDKFEGLIGNNFISSLNDNHDLRQINTLSNERLKKHTFISSWNHEKYETYPLWKVYTDYRTAISIKTTVGKLIQSLKREVKTEQYIGTVEYIDFF